MNLFGAATTGVDPQTGKYLSKEQRVAMFRASRGQGGGTAGGGNNSAGSQVTPKTAIVVANKFSEITQTLSNNYQTASAGVAEQVAENRARIENLYRIVYDRRKEDLKREKQETRNTLIGAERSKRGLKEGFVEGISSAAAAAVAPLQKAAAAVQKPIMSLWDKIRNALLLLTAAWVIDNLPAILKKFDEFFGSIKSLKNTLTKALVNIRGVFGIFDGIIRGIVRGIGAVIKTAYRVGKTIFQSAFRLGRAVFNAIKKVVETVVRTIFKGIRALVGGIGNAYRAARGLLPGGNKPTTPKLPDKQPKNVFQRLWGKVTKAATGLKEFAGNQYGKLKEGADKFMTGFSNLRSKAMEKLNPIQAQATKDGIEKGTTASREKGVKSLLTRILEKAGIKGGKGLMNNPVLKKLLKLPGIGIAIDVILNKAGGQGVAESLIRGFSSGIAGMVGAKAGAAVGAGVGTIAIPIPGIGTAVGGILGGIIGSILAANTADSLAKAGMESVGMETTSDAQMRENYEPVVESVIGSNKSSTAGQPSPAAAITPSTPSTPDGMQVPEGSNTTNNVTVEQMPPIMENIEREKKEVIPEQPVPTISTRDPQTDLYRAMASKSYQLNLAGTF
ncbi:hypothetical protein BOW86_gp009 [Synechococcus phage S-CAM7]|uniref:Tail tape measure protein n=1 Tax=Synechococcus phage S-CAM7 TaxID=1883368 RepID=A0A1D8KTA8_9CAUD|nr:hypothetical protein BOW86_gp009 [Synechococcus phage S-CAM7]AOV61933.1 hypothetical protein C490910_009 [Synechococcus phage S-CAM7]